MHLLLTETDTTQRGWGERPDGPGPRRASRLLQNAPPDPSDTADPNAAPPLPVPPGVAGARGPQDRWPHSGPGHPPAPPSTRTAVAGDSGWWAPLLGLLAIGSIILLFLLFADTPTLGQVTVLRAGGLDDRTLGFIAYAMALMSVVAVVKILSRRR